MSDKFAQFRQKYPVFSYNGYHMEKNEEEIRLWFDFEIEGLCEFHPETRIPIKNLPMLNDFDTPTAGRIVFSLGLTEAVSYWKASCSPSFVVRCGCLSSQQTDWWKKLWYNGLGEFFYRNGIETNEKDFVTVSCDADSISEESTDYKNGGIHIVPVGGGKDSAVTLGLLSDQREQIYCFTVNDQQAREDTVKAAGLSTDRIIRTYRTIDKNLLKLNAEGFLNGHTPFSAIVAFLSLYCGYLLGAEDIILSNESSANESNIQGTDVNHQYSKSYEFEQDFRRYVEEYIGISVNYFSLLRPFNEMQIAKQFSAMKQYHGIFKSCNVGSKKNIWCCDCAKCLFVYIILSPFLTVEELRAIFSQNLLDKESLSDDFDGLCGISDVKPFECIGTVREVRAALNMTVKKYKENGIELPLLLKRYECFSVDDPLNDFNSENGVPSEMKKYIEEMYNFVRSSDQVFTE